MKRELLPLYKEHCGKSTIRFLKVREHLLEKCFKAPGHKMDLSIIKVAIRWKHKEDFQSL
jgi:hypothetical protein